VAHLPPFAGTVTVRASLSTKRTILGVDHLLRLAGVRVYLYHVTDHDMLLKTRFPLKNKRQLALSLKLGLSLSNLIRHLGNVSRKDRLGVAFGHLGGRHHVIPIEVFRDFNRTKCKQFRLSVGACSLKF